MIIDFDPFFDLDRAASATSGTCLRQTCSGDDASPEGSLVKKVKNVGGHAHPRFLNSTYAMRNPLRCEIHARPLSRTEKSRGPERRGISPVRENSTCSTVAGRRNSQLHDGARHSIHRAARLANDPTIS